MKKVNFHGQEVTLCESMKDLRATSDGELFKRWFSRAQFFSYMFKHGEQDYYFDDEDNIVVDGYWLVGRRGADDWSIHLREANSLVGMELEDFLYCAKWWETHFLLEDKTGKLWAVDTDVD